MVSTNLISPSSMTNIYDVFSNTVLSSSSGGQARAIEMPCILLSPGDTTDRQISRNYSTPGTPGFFFDIL